jgi:hypothetical protein
MRRNLVMGVMLMGLAGAAHTNVSSLPPEPHAPARVARLDLSAISASRPASPLKLLFIHHSVGGVWLADAGPAQEDGGACIYRTHPNGGSLRSLLEREGYEVHETSYGSQIGEKTDLFDWLPKFRDQMDRLVATDHNDTMYRDGGRNQIVVFKSCFPNSAFVGDGDLPGNPAGRDLTVANARATMRALLPEFRKRPDVLFVYVTAPPLAPQVFTERRWKWLVKRLIGKPTWADEFAAQASLARRFNNWVSATDGWLAEYPLTNVAVFDYYDILTGHGASDLLRFPTEDGIDSHPARDGNVKASDDFVPFLNRVVRRAGLSQ